MRSSVLFILTSISTDSNINVPYVNIQPHIFISKCGVPYYSESLGGDENMSLANTVISGRNRLLALEFSICYDTYSKYGLCSNADIYKLDEIQVFIEKFKSKDFFNAKFDGNIHVPQTIYLPMVPYTLAGFELFISPFVSRKDFGFLRKGCQIVSLFFDQEVHMKRTVASLRHAIFCFRILMGIQLYEEPEAYAFRFGIKIKEKFPKHSNSFPCVINTNMFKLLFSKDGLHVNLRIVDKKRYYCFD